MSEDDNNKKDNNEENQNLGFSLSFDEDDEILSLFDDERLANAAMHK